MQDDWPDLTDVEARATAAGRLDLHYEHQDALAVERVTWQLCDHVRRYARLQVVIGDFSLKGEIIGVGQDCVHLSTGLVRLAACEEIRPLGRGQHGQEMAADFRRAVRQYAGRVPRDLVLVGGRSMIVGLDWVGADFVHVRVAGRPALLPLTQVAAVLGAV
jgi:hypothetical protein